MSTANAHEANVDPRPHATQRSEKYREHLERRCIKMAVGLLLLRLGVGLILVAHGAQKLFGWFGGPGLTGTGQFLETLGFRNGKHLGLLAGGTEVIGGALVAAGLLTPLGAATIIP